MKAACTVEKRDAPVYNETGALVHYGLVVT